MMNSEWFASQSDPRRDPEIGREGRELLTEAMARGLKIQMQELASMIQIMKIIKKRKEG